MFEREEKNMKKLKHYTAALLILIPLSILAQQYVEDSGKVKVIILKDPYSDSRTGPELLKGPDHLASGGLLDVLQQSGCEVAKVIDIKMPQELEREYGEWNRASLTNRVLGKAIYANDKDEYFYIGLLSGSKSLVGMLSGLQHLGPGRSPLKDSEGNDIIGLPRLGKGKPLTVGLVWIDSKGAFNTPDITIEGDMGGMNVAVAAGINNSTMRLQAGLDPPLSTKYIVMAGLQDTNPYEQVHIDSTFIETLSVDEIKNVTENIDIQMKRLSKLTDIIYVHVDLGVLDPKEIPEHLHPPPYGPTSDELASFLMRIFKFPKVTAIGIASMSEKPADISLKAAYKLIVGAIEGVKNR